MSKNHRKKISSVESIRGLACLMVFLSHLSSTFAPSMHTGNAANARTPVDMLLHNSPFAFIYSGAAAVGIFFVLSGFIIGYAILERGNAQDNAVSMVIKRYFRLAPVAIFSVIIAFIIFRFTHIDTSELADWANNYNIKNPSFLDALYSGAVSPFFYGSSEYNWSLWTMKIELFGTLSLCLLVFITQKTEFKKTIIAIFMITPFFMNLKPGDETYYASFFSGFMIYQLNINFNKTIGLSTLILGLYLCGFHSTSTWYQWINNIIHIKVNGKIISNYLLINNVGGFFVVISIIKTEYISCILSNKPLNILGALSFSVYAIHQPLMHFLSPVFFNLMAYSEFNYLQSFLATSFITIIITYALSIPVYFYIDKKSVVLCKKIESIIIR